MKSQKRHELQTNELADHLGRYMQAIKPYQNLVLFGVVAAIVIVGGVLWLSNQQTAKASASWSEYFVALGQQRADGLEEVAQIHDGSNAALWALQSAGDIKLSSGEEKMYQNRDEAKTDLKDAEKNFKKVEEGATKNPELVSRARFGLARVYETMCDVPKATDYYKQVAQSAPDSAIGKLAERRFNKLSDESVEKWYNWFERQEPAPPTPPGGPGANPLGDLGDLPERPDLSAPFASSLDGLLSDPVDSPAGPDLAPADQPSDSTDETEMPAEPTESSATEEPATEEPATEEPATEEPATEEPATEEPATEEPATEEPATEEPATEEPATEEPATEEPATEEPATESEAPAPSADEPPGSDES